LRRKFWYVEERSLRNKVVDFQPLRSRVILTFHCSDDWLSFPPEPPRYFTFGYKTRPFCLEVSYSRRCEVARGGFLCVGSAVFIFFQPKCFRVTLVQLGNVDCYFFPSGYWNGLKTGQVFCGGGRQAWHLLSRRRMGCPGMRQDRRTL
jgi:hypothetical protein